MADTCIRRGATSYYFIGMKKNEGIYYDRCNRLKEGIKSL